MQDMLKLIKDRIPKGKFSKETISRLKKIASLDFQTQWLTPYASTLSPSEYRARNAVPPEQISVRALVRTLARRFEGAWMYTTIDDWVDAVPCFDRTTNSLNTMLQILDDTEIDTEEEMSQEETPESEMGTSGNETDLTELDEEPGLKDENMETRGEDMELVETSFRPFNGAALVSFSDWAKQVYRPPYVPEKWGWGPPDPVPGQLDWAIRVCTF